MSIDKDILDRLMEGRAPGDLFGKDGILSELTKALAERALSTEMDIHLDEERAELDAASAVAGTIAGYRSFSRAAGHAHQAGALSRLLCGGVPALARR